MHVWPLVRLWGNLETSPYTLCACMHSLYCAAGTALRPEAGKASVRAQRDAAHIWRGSVSGRGSLTPSTSSPRSCGEQPQTHRATVQEGIF